LKNIKFSFDAALIPQKSIRAAKDQLKAFVRGIASGVPESYPDVRAHLDVLDDKEMLEKVKRCVAEKRKLKPEYFVVVGIGGSNLGTTAVQEAVLGKLYNQLSPQIKILNTNNIDSSYIKSIIELIEPVIRRGDNVILNVISKSGSTTETVANFQVLLKLLRKYKKDYKGCVVITSDAGSKLWAVAQKGFDYLEIPKRVQGRYSVFSPVGTFPLGMLGVKVDDLLEGARAMRDACLEENLDENPAATSAVIQYLHHLSGKNISDLFLFSSDLESVGKWWRQLFAESIGKEFDNERVRVNVGMTPTVSIGTTDLHSIAQLYLGGPRDKLTTFVSAGKGGAEIEVPPLEIHPDLVDEIHGRTLGDIMDAILGGTKAAFRKDGRPFMEIHLSDKSEGSIGQLMQFKIMETIYLSHLLNVNPFNQPKVESYKEETRKILHKKK